MLFTLGLVWFGVTLPQASGSAFIWDLSKIGIGSNSRETEREREMIFTMLVILIGESILTVHNI